MNQRRKWKTQNYKTRRKHCGETVGPWMCDGFLDMPPKAP